MVDSGVPGHPTAEGDEVDAGDRPPPRATPAGLAAAVLSALLLIGFSPALETSVWAPKAAAALVLAGIGVPMLARERSRAALAASLFLAVATVSTLLSDNPGMALVGLWNWGTGLLLVAAAVGAWALGRSFTPADRRLLEHVLIAGGLVLAAITLIQVRTNLSAYGILEKFGQPTALMGNPVYLAGALLLPAAIAIWRSRLSYWAVPMVGVFAIVITLSRTRAAILLVFLLALVQLRRNWRSTLAIGAVVVGWSAGVWLIAAPSEQSGPNLDVAAVVTTTNQTYTAREGPGPRVASWLLAIEAVAERPVVGAGPGRYMAATAPHRTLDFARQNPNEYFADAHNFIVEYAVTTGVLGLVALLAWIALASVGASGALALAALAGGLIQLVHAQNVAVTPLVMLCLGAAGRRPAPSRPLISRRAQALVTAMGGGAALLVAGQFLAGQVALRQAYLDLDPTAAKAAYRLLPFWPEPAYRRAIATADDVIGTESEDWSEVRRYMTEAARRDESDPRQWVRLGDFERSRKDAPAAEAAYRRALAIDPWSSQALRGLVDVALAQGDTAGAAIWERRWRLVAGPQVQP